MLLLLLLLLVENLRVKRVSSILKKLQQKQNKKIGTVLKAGLVLLIENQNQFNKLASLFEEVQEDSILIDGIYVAYLDEYPALQVCPISEFSEEIEDFIESCEHKNLKPVDFDRWYKNNAK